MAKTCASCLAPIAKGQAFVIAGTEVFHRKTWCIQNIAASVGTERKLRIVELETMVGRLRNEARQDADRRLDEQARIYNDVTCKLRRDLDAQRSRDLAMDSARADQISRLTRERDQLAAELRRLHGEIALRQAIGSRADQPTTVTVTAVAISATPAPEIPPEPVTPAKDDAEQRFSLLELDPLE